MDKKWLFRILILVVLACFGVFQDEVRPPNQAIVLEFVSTDINEQNITIATDDLKEKLQHIGVSNITIKETQNGTFKISYYSNTPIQFIKDALAEENQYTLNQDPNKNDKEAPSSEYSIAIYEISNETDLSNLNDKYVLEIKYVSERFTTSQSPAFFEKLELQKHKQLFKTAYIASRNNSLTKDKITCRSPEVRAGPLYFSI